MHITTPAEIESIAWEGYLESCASEEVGPEDYLGADEFLLRVTLGEPAWWPAEQAVEGETSKKWAFPSTNRRYTLLRLACTLHPPDDARIHYTEATLTAYLRPRHNNRDVTRDVIAHDLYPQRLTVETKGKLNIGLNPELKFVGLVEVSLLQAGTIIEYHKVFPTIQAYGLSESTPYWRFARHATSPLLGCQSVYAVVDAPQDAGGVRLSIELTATAKTHHGPIRLRLPQEAQVNLGRRIGI